ERVSAEAAYGALQDGSLEAGLASSNSEDLRALVKRLNEATERFADVKALYGSNYPEYARLEAVVIELKKQVDQTRQSLSRQAANDLARARTQESLLQKDVTE